MGINVNCTDEDQGHVGWRMVTVIYNICEGNFGQWKENMHHIIDQTIILALCTFILSSGMLGCSGVRPATLGVKDGKLSPCPSTANCVTSQSSDREHAIEPLTYMGASSVAHDKLKRVLLGMKRAKIITDTNIYIHAEFTSAVWRFVDDVEFYIEESMKEIHIRSASRLGTYDFGENRKRLESIRALWNIPEK